MSMDGRPGVISVIVPVYKVEDYLEACVESILTQSYRNLEIILVDDGSPDRCPALCDAVAERDSRVKVVHQENQGLAMARNAGLCAATGEYVVFCDSDDMAPPMAYERLVNRAVSTKADLVCGAIESINDTGKSLLKWVPDSHKARSGMLALEHPLVNATLFKRGFIKRHNIKFCHSIIGEDVIFSAKVFFCKPRIACIEDAVYLYRMREKEENPSLSQRKDFAALAAAITCRIEETKVAIQYRDKAAIRFCACLFYVALNKWYHANGEYGKELFALVQEYAGLFRESREKQFIAEWCGINYREFLEIDEKMYLSYAAQIDWDMQDKKYMAASGQMGLKEICTDTKENKRLLLQCVVWWMEYKRLSIGACLRLRNSSVYFPD